MFRVITNDVSDYINVLVRIAHIICNHLNIYIYIYMCVCVCVYVFVTLFCYKTSGSV